MEDHSVFMDKSIIPNESELQDKLVSLYSN